MWYAHCMCCFFMMSNKDVVFHNDVRRFFLALCCVTMNHECPVLDLQAWSDTTWLQKHSNYPVAKKLTQRQHLWIAFFGGNFGPRTMASTRSHSLTWKRKLGNRWLLMNTFHAKLWKENRRLVMPNRLVKNYGFFWWRRPGLAIGNWAMLKASRRSPIGATLCAK